MKVLLTGASGFIGKALCNQLISEKYTIIAPVRALNLLTDDDLLFPIKYKGLQHEVEWTSMLEKVDVVIHLASRVHIMDEKSNDPLIEFRKINVDATLKLAQKAINSGVKRFIYLSSIKVNGEESFPTQPFRADDTPSPKDPYGISKYEAETGLFRLARESEMEIVIIRPPLVYGPGVKANFKQIMNIVGKGLPLPFGAINNKRSFVALDNLNNFIIKCVNHPSAANQVFLISDGYDLSLTELLKKLSISLNSSTYLFSVPVWWIRFLLRLIGKRNISLRLFGWLQVDISKNKELTGWIPNSNVDEYFKQTVNYFIKHNS